MAGLRTSSAATTVMSLLLFPGGDTSIEHPDNPSSAEPR